MAPKKDKCPPKTLKKKKKGSECVKILFSTSDYVAHLSTYMCYCYRKWQHIDLAKIHARAGAPSTRQGSSWGQSCDFLHHRQLGVPPVGVRQAAQALTSTFNTQLYPGSQQPGRGRLLANLSYFRCAYESLTSCFRKWRQKFSYRNMDWGICFPLGSCWTIS